MYTEVTKNSMIQHLKGEVGIADAGAKNLLNKFFFTLQDGKNSDVSEFCDLANSSTLHANIKGSKVFDKIDTFDISSKNDK